MKIVFLVDSLHSIAAGSERQIFKLISGLSQHQHQVELVLLRHTNFTREGFDFPCDVRCLDIASIATLSTAKKMLAMRHQLKSKKVDVIHAYFPDSCLLAPLYLKSKNVKVFTSRRDMGLIYNGKPSALYRALRFRTDGVIANSWAVAELVKRKEKLPRSKSLVAYNGIEPYDPVAQEAEDALYNDQKAIKLIMVANIKPVKRTLDAVRAVGSLRERGHRVELALAGEPQDKEYVERIKYYIDSNGLNAAIHWLGQVNEPRRIIPQADMGLLISESEGLSNTLMEYMQLGLPSVATNVGGNPELVEDGVNGKLIDRGNIEQLVEAIEEIASDEQLKASMSSAAKRKMEEEFSIATMVRRHETFYSERKRLKKETGNEITG